MSQLTMSGANSAAPRMDGFDGALEPKYKVFLSHNMAQKAFVEQLCMEWEDCFQLSFFDKYHDSLTIEEKLPEHIFEAIQQCNVGVVILSEDFFTSKWLMMELTTLVEEAEKRSNFKVIPLFLCTSIKEFYDPINCTRWQSSWHELALEDKSYEIVVEKWKAALKYLQSINGLVYDGLNGLKFGKVVIDAICEIVRAEIKYEDLNIQARSHIYKEIQNKIDESTKDMTHGIYWMELDSLDSIGKTSICRALCNEYFTIFCSKACHVEPEGCSRKNLLQKVLKQLSNTNLHCLHMFDQHEMKNGPNEEIIEEATFFVLNNVSSTNTSIIQVRNYLSAKLPYKSTILVLVHTMDPLTSLRPFLSENNYMEILKLNIDEAKSLSMTSSNFEPKISNDHQVLDKSMERCGFLKDGDDKSYHYHPLELVHLASSLLCINSKKWKEQLKKIDEDFVNQSKDDQSDIFSILQFNCDSLLLKEQLLKDDVHFLFKDDAHFLAEMECLGGDLHFEWLIYGFPRTYYLKRPPKRLKRKSMLEHVDNQLETGIGGIGVHVFPHEFCMAEIKAGKFKWQYEACKVDKCNELVETATSSSCWENVRRMALHYKLKSLKRLDFAHFPNVTGLMILGLQIEEKIMIDLLGLVHQKILVVNESNIDKLIVQGLPKDLVYLRFGNSSFNWKSKSDSEDFVKEIECLKKLQHLELFFYRCDKLPNMRGMVSVYVVLCQGCANVVTLIGLNSQLKNLRVMDFRECTRLRSCPNIEDLEYLKEFTCTGCENLEKLPNLQKLKKLQKLNVSRCSLINEILGLDDLVALEKLDALKCSKLSKLSAMHKLSKLQSLDLRCCQVLKELPDCDNLTDIHRWITTGHKGLCNLTMLQSSVNRDHSKIKDVINSGIGAFYDHGNEEVGYIKSGDWLPCGVQQVNVFGTTNVADDSKTINLDDFGSRVLNLSKSKDEISLQVDMVDHLRIRDDHISRIISLDYFGNQVLNFSKSQDFLSLDIEQVHHLGFQDVIDVPKNKAFGEGGCRMLNLSKCENALFLGIQQFGHFGITHDVFRTTNFNDCRSGNLDLSKDGDLDLFKDGDWNLLKDGDVNLLKEGDLDLLKDGDVNFSRSGNALSFGIQEFDHSKTTHVTNVFGTTGFDDRENIDSKLYKNGDLNLFEDEDLNLLRSEDALFLSTQQFGHSKIIYVTNAFGSASFNNCESGDLKLSIDGDLNLSKNKDALSFDTQQFDYSRFIHVTNVSATIDFDNCQSGDLDLSKDGNLIFFQKGDALSLGIKEVDYSKVRHITNVCDTIHFNNCESGDLNLFKRKDLDLSKSRDATSQDGHFELRHERKHVIDVSQTTSLDDIGSGDLMLIKTTNSSTPKDAIAFCGNGGLDDYGLQNLNRLSKSGETLLSLDVEGTDSFGSGDGIDDSKNVGLDDCGSEDLNLSFSGDTLSLGIDHLNGSRSRDLSCESENGHLRSSRRFGSELEGIGTQREGEGFSADSTASLESREEASAESNESCYRPNSSYIGRKRSTAAIDEDDLIARIAPIVNKQIDDALKPLISILHGHEEDEQKHQEIMLEIEKQKLALKHEKMHFLTLLGAPSNSCNSEMQCRCNTMCANFMGNSGEALKAQYASSAKKQHFANPYPTKGLVPQLWNARGDVCNVYGAHSLFQTSTQTGANFGSSMEGILPFDATYDDALRANHPGQWQLYPDTLVACPRCGSLDARFCYCSNVNIDEPQHLCENHRHYWTAEGTLPNVPVGANHIGTGGLQWKNRTEASELSFKQSQLTGEISPMRSPGTGSAFGQESWITTSSPPYWIHQNEQLPFQSYACSQGFITSVSAGGSFDPASTLHQRLQQLPSENGFEKDCTRPTQDAVNLGVMQLAQFTAPMSQQLESSVTCRSVASPDIASSSWGGNDGPVRFFNGDYPHGYHWQWSPQLIGPAPASQWNVGYASHPQMATSKWLGDQSSGPFVSSTQQQQPVSLNATLGKRSASNSGRLDDSQLPAKALRTGEHSRSFRSRWPTHGTSPM